MNGTEFIRRVRRYAKKNDLILHFDSKRGKGSHGTLHLSGRFTVVQRGELKPGTLRNMLKQLDIPKEEF